MRKAQAKKLPIAPDPKFKDKAVTRFVNCLMIGGNKTVVLTAFYNALDKVTEMTSETNSEYYIKLEDDTSWTTVKSDISGSMEVVEKYKKAGE